MRFLSSLVLLSLTLTLTPTPTVAQAQQTCTHGRLFIGDKSEAKVHVVDLDDHKEIAVLPAGGSNPDIYTTESNIILAAFGGTRNGRYDDGITQFYDDGITLDDHGVYMHVDKIPPFVYDFTVRGPKVSHVVDDADYVAIFHDGDYKTRKPASAYFVKHSEFHNKSSTIQPVIITPGGAQHGYAYATSDERFVVTVAHPDRVEWKNEDYTTPIGFGVYAKDGTLVQNISRLDDPRDNCIGYHGSGSHLTESVHGCKDYKTTQEGLPVPTADYAGVLTMVYDPTTMKVTTNKLKYNNNNNDGRRISTLENQPGTNIMVGLYANQTTSSFVTFTATSTNLLEDATRVYNNPEQGSPCMFTFETGPNKRLLVYWSAGLLRVMIPSPTWSVERTIMIPNLSTCGALSFTTGYNHLIISDSAAKNMRIIDISNGNIITTPLDYTPGSIALVVPNKAQCKTPIPAPITPAPGTTTPPPTGTGTTTPPPTGTGTTTPPPSKPSPGPFSEAPTTTTVSSLITFVLVPLVALIQA